MHQDWLVDLEARNDPNGITKHHPIVLHKLMPLQCFRALQVQSVYRSPDQSHKVKKLFFHPYLRTRLLR